MTQEQFNQNYGRIAMPKPFAHDGFITPIANIGDSTHPVNFEDGFPSEYSAPHSQGGKYVSRGEMNAIGNLATRNDFYKACGGLNTFDANLAVLIGGYPKGAVLQMIQQGALWFVESLEDNNKHDFLGRTPTASQAAAGIVAGSVDGRYWRFCYESKYVEQDENLLTSVDESNLPLTEVASVNILTKECKKSGIVTLRNLDYSFGASGTRPGGIDGRGHFIGVGIIIRSISRSQGDSLTPLYANAASAGPWTCARMIHPGTYGPASYDLLSSLYLPGGQFSLKFSVPNGLLSVNSGDILCVDYINSETSIATTAGGTSYWNPLNVKFDIYII